MLLFFIPRADFNLETIKLINYNLKYLIQFKLDKAFNAFAFYYSHGQE